jgi:hypothetical protein
VAAAREHNEAPLHPAELEAWASWALSEAEALDPLSASLTNLLASAEPEKPDSADD